MQENMLIEAKPRQFLPADFVLTHWESVKPFFENLYHRNLENAAQIEEWLHHLSELEAVLSEEACWRQIRMTCDTTNAELEQAFAYFCTQIQPHLQTWGDKLNRKLMDSPLRAELPQAQYYTYLRRVEQSIALYRDENVPIQSELSVQQQEFGSITSKMTVEVQGQEYTLQQAAKFLESKDRNLREQVYRKMQNRRLQDKTALDNLFSSLVAKRDTLAKNAGFANYRDYAFAALNRFDYGKEECFAFHAAVKQHVLPLVEKIYAAKAKKLGLEKLRPWDLEASPADEQPLKPFTNGADLLEKTKACFAEMDPFFAQCLQQMEQMNRFDLESRKGKAPGGYNCPLAETGAPFIFMNAAGQMDDVSTMVHEGGHAIHSFLAHPLPLTGFKEYPMEIAEVASMAMELMSMKHWEAFFGSDRKALAQAREHQLERVITIFPWIAIIDEFQHWVYEHPGHSVEERTQNWLRILNSYSVPSMDTTGLDEYRANGWQKQLHLYEVPFYYIEYGIAQLGAIGMWMQYQANAAETIEKYKQALSLGGTRTLPELYAAAGLRFDFGPAHMKTLMDFVHEEMEKPLA